MTFMPVVLVKVKEWAISISLCDKNVIKMQL